MKLEMRGIDKSFGSVPVLKNMQLEILPGEIHALVGENGAGKSTLMKILGGVIQRDAGEIIIDNKPVEISKVRDAEKLGIAIIHQELSIIPDMTLAENIFLGNEIRTSLGIVDTKRMNQKVSDVLGKLGLAIHPTEKARGLGVGQLQLVEVAKALIHKAQLIVMDEPTSALTDREIERLFDIIRGLKNEGVSFIYISHRLDELFAICDRLTVLRDGEYIGTARIKEISFNQVISMMVGREIGDRFPRKTNKPQDVLLEVKNLSRAGAFKNIHFSLRKGEILGIAGLMGAGRTELVRSLFGAEPADSGEIILKGTPVNIHSPKEAMQLGIGLVTEDRKLEGLFLDFAIDFNMMTTNFDALAHYGLLQNRKVRSYAEELVQALRIKTRSVQEKVSNLSGGNQQKVVVAKWLGREPEILILDEPTRGVDVGAKREIYEIINQLSEKGVAIIMVSSELPEIVGMSDRVLVMRLGQQAGILDSPITQEHIMSLATGV
ncbi:MAG TPA: sugar ABC transporter ATP-binding protein [Spirochaetales bacterium]|nr:sugar ABC transporter ATP-binding protein [Spirochaetales bacterium]